MAIQTSFSRVERKYLVSKEQKAALLECMAGHAVPDVHPRYTVSNVYYDTPDRELIRTSLEKPLFKQKLRLRSYGVPGDKDPAFAEIKKKYDGRVYKRRVTLPTAEAVRYLSGFYAGEKGQIHREIDWFLRTYRPKPALYLAYDREAYGALAEPELRITFDKDIRYRLDELDLRAGDRGRGLQLPGELLEIKTPDSFPLWLVRALEELKIPRISFSKCGEIYRIEQTASKAGTAEGGKTAVPEKGVFYA